MTKMGGWMVLVVVGVAALGATACGSEDAGVASEATPGMITEGFTLATRYDNSAAPPVRKSSRVLRRRLDEQAKTATLVSETLDPPTDSVERWVKANSGCGDGQATP